MYAKVREIHEGVVQFEPLCRGISYRHASAREIVGHWHRALADACYLSMSVARSPNLPTLS